jgi:hypothetical protein
LRLSELARPISFLSSPAVPVVHYLLYSPARLDFGYPLLVLDQRFHLPAFGPAQQKFLALTNHFCLSSLKPRLHAEALLACPLHLHYCSRAPYCISLGDPSGKASPPLDLLLCNPHQILLGAISNPDRTFELETTLLLFEFSQTKQSG